MPAGPTEKRRPLSLRSGWQNFLEESSILRHYLWKYRKLTSLGLLSLVIVDGLEVVPPILLKESVDVAIAGTETTRLARFALLYLGVAFVQAVGRYCWRIFLVRASLSSGKDLRSEFTKHLFGLSASFFDRRPIGELMSMATSDVEAVRMTLGMGMLVMADAVFYFATVPIAMYLLSPKLTLLAFLPLPFIPWIVLRNEREVHSRFEKVQECFSRLSAMVQESLNGVRVTKGFAKEDAQGNRFRKIGEEYMTLGLRLSRVQSAFGPTLDFAMSAGLVSLLYIGGKDLISGGAAAVSLGTFVAFQRYIQKMVWPMAALGVALSTYQRSVSSSGRLKEVLGVSTDVPEDTSPRLPADAPASPHRLTWKTRGEVEFRDLRFRFPGADTDVLRGISLQIGAGERVAFIGAIGAGKSALLSLLPRLYPVRSGSIFIDRVDINHWPLADLRRQVGYVGQDVFLFSETVVENIAYGLAGWSEQTGDVSGIEDATRLACVHDDVLGLTASYRTRVGERGVNLSGGQKQRLTIARAIIRNPPILILDDALSSVDVQTEERILASLRARTGRNTEIIAAHRMSTIQDADRIVVLEAGALTQLGTHAELMRQRSGIYRRFYDQQRLRADLENYSDQLELAQPEIQA